MSSNSWIAILILLIIIVLFILSWVILFPWLSQNSNDNQINCSFLPTTGWGGECQLDQDCAGDLLCTNNKCRSPLGGPCFVLNDCAAPSNYCFSAAPGIIGRCIQRTEGVCAANQNCPEGSLATFDDRGNCLCLRAGGTICDRGSQCKSGECMHGYCAPPRQIGQQCMLGQCDTGLECSLGRCQSEGIISGTESAYCLTDNECNLPLQCLDKRCTTGKRGLTGLEKCIGTTGECRAPWSCLSGYCRLAQAPQLFTEQGVFHADLTQPQLIPVEPWPQQLQSLTVKRWAGKYILTDAGLYFDQQLIWTQAIIDISWDEATRNLWVLRHRKLYIIYHTYQEPVQWTEQEWTGPEITEIDVYQNKITARTTNGEIILPEQHISQYRSIGYGTQPRWINSTTVGFIDSSHIARTETRIIGPKWFNELGEQYIDSSVQTLIANPFKAEVLLVIRIKGKQFFLGWEKQQIFDTLPWKFNYQPIINLNPVGLFIAHYGLRSR